MPNRDARFGRHNKCFETLLGAQSAQNTSVGVTRVRGLLANELINVFVRQQQVALYAPRTHWLEHARLASPKGPLHGWRFLIGLCMRKLKMGCVEWVHGLRADNGSQMMTKEKSMILKFY
jgi:hypothetical protein